MNIQSVTRLGALQSSAQQSAYLYGLNPEYLPAKSPDGRSYVAIDMPARMDTVYQFRQTEGWLGDMPVSLTYLMAYRSYEYTRQVFSNPDWKTAIKNVNSWLV